TWSNVVTQFDEVNSRLRVFDPQHFATLKAQALNLSVNALPSFAPAVAAPFPLLPQELHTLVTTLERDGDILYKAALSLASTGIFVSFCSPNKTRTWALELGLTTLQADSNPGWAHDYTIRLNTLSIGVSYRLPTRPGDFFDLGIIGGANQ